MTSAAVTDSDLWNLLNVAISKYPNLNALKPIGWPSDPKYDITRAKLSNYMNGRRGEYVINLPLILFNLEVNPHMPFVTLFSSIMKALDLFCVDFISAGIPGADKTIKPIWTDNWSLTDSRFFAVVAEVYFTYFLKSKGYTAKEFERPYNPAMTGKSADILFDFNGKDVFLDIKSPKSMDRIWCKRQMRRKIEDVAHTNMNNELQHLLPGSYGIIAHLYRPLGPASRWFKFKNSALDVVKHPTDQNKFSQIYWIKPVFTVHGRDLVVFDNTLDFSQYLMRPWWKRKFLITKYYLLNQLGLLRRYILLLFIKE